MLAASREVLESPTVVVTDLPDEVPAPAEAAAPPLDIGALEAAALEAGPEAMALAEGLLTGALEATVAADEATDAAADATEVDDLLAVAVPVVELQPASSSAAPNAAVRLMRFMCWLLVVDAGRSWGMQTLAA